jgi:hypothetical protein
MFFTDSAGDDPELVQLDLENGDLMVVEVESGSQKLVKSLPFGDAASGTGGASSRDAIFFERQDARTFEAKQTRRRNLGEIVDRQSNSWNGCYAFVTMNWSTDLEILEVDPRGAAHRSGKIVGSRDIVPGPYILRGTI